MGRDGVERRLDRRRTARPRRLRRLRLRRRTALRRGFAGLPRVRYWEAWNEPNLFVNLLPQYDTPLSEPVTANSKPLSGKHYRRLLNAFAASAHRVHRDNVVIGGNTAPFGRYGAGEHGVAPMVFMRQMLCMTRRNRPEPGCHGRANLDVWSHHPYTEGGPTHKAESRDNVQLGDLPRMRRLLRAAIKAGHIRSRRQVRFWVTEFAWDTNPPDPERRAGEAARPGGSRRRSTACG